MLSLPFLKEYSINTILDNLKNEKQKNIFGFSDGIQKVVSTFSDTRTK